MDQDRVNILYVEDEMDLQIVLDMSLKQFDQINYKIVSSAEQALTYLQENKIDAIISDHYLPGMQGIELLEQIKTEYPQIERFLITGSVMSSVFESAQKKADPAFVFEKPVIVDDIISKVLSILTA